MSISTSIAAMLRNIAKKLDLTVQDEKKRLDGGDYAGKSEGISFTDMMTGSLANLQCLDFTLPVVGDSVRAMWLNTVADNYVNLKLINTVQTCFNTGDAIVVPFWNGRNIQNILVSADEFVITERFGDEITGLVYLADEVKVKDDKFQLIQSIRLETVSDEAGTFTVNRYQLFVGRNGEPYIATPASITEAWSEYNPDWYIPAVNRLLIGRLKSNANDPKRPNPVKGIPICVGAKKPISELHYLYDQFHIEFELSEKFVAADKTLFQAKTRKTPDVKVKKGLRLPRGRNRVVMEVAPNRGVDQAPFMKEWSPDIRNSAYAEAIQEQYRLFENCVGVSEGVVSRIESAANYENVDNVRKSMRKTQAFINTARKCAEEFFEGLVYSWDILANYYEITPAGEFEVQYNWSDEYINTFNDRMSGLIQGEAVGAVSPADIRSYLFNEPPEVAKSKVAEISAAQMVGIATESGSEAPSGGSVDTNAMQEAMTSLNGAQITALTSIIAQYKEGILDRDEAIELVMALGVPRSTAERMVKERVSG